MLESNSNPKAIPVTPKMFQFSQKCIPQATLSCIIYARCYKHLQLCTITLVKKKWKTVYFLKLKNRTPVLYCSLEREGDHNKLNHEHPTDTSCSINTKFYPLDERYLQCQLSAMWIKI